MLYNLNNRSSVRQGRANTSNSHTPAGGTSIVVNVMNEICECLFAVLPYCRILIVIHFSDVSDVQPMSTTGYGSSVRCHAMQIIIAAANKREHWRCSFLSSCGASAVNECNRHAASYVPQGGRLTLYRTLNATKAGVLGVVMFMRYMHVLIGNAPVPGKCT